MTFPPLVNSWRIQIADILKDVHRETLLTDFYQFGVWTCRSMKDMIDIARYIGLSEPEFWGFDSFEGLPDEPAEPIYEEIKAYGIDDWCKGMYSSRDWFKTGSVPEAMDACYSTLETYLRKIDKPLWTNNLQLIPGFWENSLTDDLAKTFTFKPALYIDMDGDIYTSTYQALDWVFKHNIAIPGTVIGYDDWGSPGFETFRTGESRAHKEITEKYGVTWRDIYQIGHRSPHVQKVFQVVSVTQDVTHDR